MKQKIKFFFILLVSLIVTWYIAEGVQWLTVLLKPMTDFGELLSRIGLHIVFGLSGLLLAISIHDK